MSNATEYDELEPIAYNHYSKKVKTEWADKLIALLKEAGIDPNKTVSVTIRADLHTTIYWTEVRRQPFPKKTFSEVRDE